VQLATKISITLISTITLASTSSIVALLFVYQLGKFMRAMLRENVASIRIAEEIEITLLEQRGYVTLYIFDSDNHRAGIINGILYKYSNKFPVFSLQ
jgi:hypothetical protein